MSKEHLGKIRSFVIVLYDRTLKERVRFAVPVSVAVPFCNRLFREIVKPVEGALKEPWYQLVPHCVHESPLQRDVEPAGPTSLYGTPYIAMEEPPPRVALHPHAHITYFTARLLDYDKQLFHGQYSVDDIFLAGAELLARNWVEKGSMQIEDGPFLYEVLAASDVVREAPRDLFPPQAYQVEGVFQLPVLAEDRERTVFRRVPPPPLGERSITDYQGIVTIGSGYRDGGLILIDHAVYEMIRKDLELSTKVENGGYLLGIPYRQVGSPENEDAAGFRWMIEITDVVQAEGTWGQPARLLFTGESWSQIARRLDQEYPSKKLVAWFHTHLFEADEFGLSGLDQELHRRFLTKPWQVAFLLNINSKYERTVRCFQRGSEDELVECAFYVFRKEARLES